MYSAPILKKSLEVLKFIVSSGTPLGVTDISKKLAISKSTVYGILSALKEERFIEKDRQSKKYVIGSELYELSRMVFKGGELIAVAKPLLEKLVMQADETAFLCVREDPLVKVIDVVETKKAFRISLPVGGTFPFTASATYKAFLSLMDNVSIRESLKEKGLPRYTENSITDIEEFLRQVERTRATGYSLDLEEYLKGIRAVAALIYTGNTPVGAVCVLGFSTSMDDDKIPLIINHVKETARLISARLSRFNTDRQSDRYDQPGGLTL
jgi:IclR family transcriptional regulator, KDG regulon repressor